MTCLAGSRTLPIEPTRQGGRDEGYYDRGGVIPFGSRPTDPSAYVVSRPAERERILFGVDAMRYDLPGPKSLFLRTATPWSSLSMSGGRIAAESR